MKNLIYVESIRSYPYMTAGKLADEFHLSPSTVYARLKEIEKEVEEGRYRGYDYTVIRDGKIVLINALVFIDYMTYRRQLLDHNARKYVPEFRPEKVVRCMGWNDRIMTMGETA
ncbi:MAG: hypothetical protein PHY47_20580 [Lachnospiraceae bacterium]|nr:hypothetical protein [Lachnospiraceae bacterium]